MSISENSSLRSFRDICCTYSRLISSYITEISELPCITKLISIEEHRLSDLFSTLGKFEMMGKADLKIRDTDASDIKCIIQLSGSLSSALIDRLTGGSGSPSYIPRDFTEIEKAVLKTVLEKMTSLLNEVMTQHNSTSVSFSGTETSTEISEISSSDRSAVTASFILKLGDSISSMTLTFHSESPEKTASCFSGRFTGTDENSAGDTARQEQRSSILCGIKEATAEVSAVLSRTQVELGDIISLQVNDIIPLDIPITHNAEVKVNNVHWFNAKPGVCKNKKAVKIVEICRSDKRR